MYISQLVRHQCSVSDGQTASSNDSIAVTMGVAEDPVVYVLMLNNKLVHVNEETTVQAAAGMAVERWIKSGAMMGYDHLVLCLGHQAAAGLERRARG